VLDATKAWWLDLTDPADVAGVPDSIRELYAQTWTRANPDADRPATGADGPWRVTLDIPSMRPFLQHAENRELRKKVYDAHVTRASSGDLDNTPLIDRILTLRQQQAEALGYENYAAMSLSRKMATLEGVDALTERLRAASLAPAKAELDEIRAFAADHGFDGEIEHHDIGFWRRQLRESRFDFTQEQLKPYFPLPRVLDGLFALVHRIFGVTIVAADGEVPVWDDDVQYFRVVDDRGATIAGFYLDPYSRPENKRGGAWMNDAQGRWRRGASVDLPIAYLVCNGTPPVGDRPSLMTFDDVETLFHEFGHGLQHMLTVVDDPDVAGIAGVEWDAVELPSQFMENWCYHEPTLIGLTRHVDTGEPLPRELFEKIVAARTFHAGTFMLRQLLYGATDIELHARYTPGGDRTPFDVMRDVAATTQVMAPVEHDRFLCAFGHIFAGGYAAGYYSYKWAEVLSADAFEAFIEAGLDDENATAEVGRRFRDTVLALGGSRHPSEVYRAFRGRDAEPDALLRLYDLAPAA